MATTLPPTEESELTSLEEQAAEHLAEEGLPVEVPEEGLVEEAPEAPLAAGRLASAVAFSTLAAAAMTGGVFEGIKASVYGALAAVLGVLIAVWASRIRRPALMHAVIVGGLFAIGLLLVVPNGLDKVFGIGVHVKEAIVAGNQRRPPVAFTSGWTAIVGWLLGGLGFAAAWVAVVVRRPALGLLIPIPVVAITAISVPDSVQVPIGIVCLVLFAVALGLLSGAQMGTEEERSSLAYELRRGVRGLFMIGAISVALFLLAQLGFLFPRPLYDPTQEAKKPKTIPLSEVKDRVLFRVKSSVTGPWRMGHLDVYDGADWRLPPFAESKLSEVPRSGVVDRELVPGVKATFLVADLGGAVLPGLPNVFGIVAEGPKLAFDERIGNIRLAEGTIKPGLEYTVVAAKVPSIDELIASDQPVPDEVKQYLEIPDPPPAVKDLLQQAPQTSTWEKLDFLRQTFLSTVTSKGQGTPVSVPPSKVQDMLAGSKTGTPYEIVAAQAILARWAGVPSRIGYGFDGGEKVGEFLEVRPKHGASYLEVYFPTFKWLPVIGTPQQAQTSITDDPQQFDPNVAASNEVAVKLYVPIALDPRSLVYAQIRAILAVAVPLILGILLLYYSWPALRKIWLRARRRTWAAEQGPAEGIALAYAEWRDTCTDFGYRFDSDTPLMFLDRVVEDDEHIELAWLVTRTLWGDLSDRATADDATAAEELSRALRKRVGQGHPATLRLIAALSRLSLRYPYAPDLGAHLQKEVAREPAAA